MAIVITGNNVDLGGGVVVRVKELCGATGGLDESSKTHSSTFDVWRPGRAAVTTAQLYQALTAYAPSTFDGMAANSISYREDEDTDHWLFTVGYNTKPIESAIRWGFDTSGGNVRMFTSKATAAFARTGRTAPDYKGAIGVKQSGKDAEPEGVEVVTPALKLTATYKHPKDTIDFAYIKGLAALTGKTNTAPFYTFAAGELLFLGGTGDVVPGIPTEIRYEFLASSNAAGLAIGDITVTTKNGHDYLWVVFEPEQDGAAKKLVQRPLAAYVERVYDFGDFSTMNIGV